MGKLYYQGPNGDILVSESSIPNLKKDKTLTEVVKDDIKEKSETMFKTINGESIIGEGNIVIEGGSGEGIPGGTANNLEVTGTSFKANVTEGISLKTHFDQSEEAIDALTENHIQLDSNGIALGQEYYHDGSSTNVHAVINEGGFGVGISNEEGNKAIFAAWCDSVSHPASFMIDGEEVPANYLKAPLFVGLDLDKLDLEKTPLGILGITEKLNQLKNNKNYNDYQCEVELNIVSGNTTSSLSRVRAVLHVNDMERPVIPGILNAKPVKPTNPEPTNPATSTAWANFDTPYGPIHAEFEFAEGSWTVTNLDLSNFRNPFDSSSASASGLDIYETTGPESGAFDFAVSEYTASELNNRLQNNRVDANSLIFVKVGSFYQRAIIFRVNRVDGAYFEFGYLGGNGLPVRYELEDSENEPKDFKVYTPRLVRYN